MYDGLEIVYVARMLRSNTIIPGKYTMSRQAFWVSLQGEQLGPIDLEEVDVLTIHPACTLSWMPYTSGATIPPGL